MPDSETLATLTGADDHTIGTPVRGTSLESLATAVICVCSPILSVVAFAVMVSRRDAAVRVTVTVMLCVTESAVADTTALPSRSAAVIKPVGEIVATPTGEIDQVTVTASG
jgi:hypothetical protein